MFKRTNSRTTYGTATRTPRAAQAAAPRSLVWLATVAALTGALLTTLLQAPANWLAHGLHTLTQGHVQLLNARGTVWRGQAQLVLTGGPGSQDRAALPGTVQWQLAPAWRRAQGTASDTTTTASPLGPALSVRIQADCCTPTGLQLWLQPSWQSLHLAVDSHASEWPADWLTGLGTPWNTLQLQARLHLSTPGLTLHITPKGVQGEGRATLDALDAASRLSTLRPMGSYRLVWQAADNAPLSLQTLQGALQLQGSGQWIAGRLRFEGQAEASPGREEALANLMNILGRRQGKRTLIKIG